LIDAVATVDDVLMHNYVEGDKISEDEIRRAFEREGYGLIRT